MKLPKKIITDRLLLLPVTLDYAEDINAGLTEEITKYMYPKPAPLEETIAWVKEKMDQFAKGEDFSVVIINNETGDFIGGGGLHKIQTKTPEFGIWTKKSSHGNHFGREAVQALKDWADSSLDCDYLLYPAAVDNIASRKIAESIGGKLVREFVDKDVRNEEMNMVEYRIYKGK